MAEPLTGGVYWNHPAAYFSPLKSLQNILVHRYSVTIYWKVNMTKWLENILTCIWTIIHHLKKNTVDPHILSHPWFAQVEGLVSQFLYQANGWVCYAVLLCSTGDSQRIGRDTINSDSMSHQPRQHLGRVKPRILPIFKDQVHVRLL